jgi:hypothetical protein
MTDSKLPKTARPRPPGGSRAGSPNKVTAEIKTMILQALDKAGGVDYLLERAHDPKTAAAFLSLLGKVMPMQVQGDPDNPMKLSVTVSFD